MSSEDADDRPVEITPFATNEEELWLTK
jgi:hypothetical protein